jgi:Animal haem peroxidase
MSTPARRTHAVAPHSCVLQPSIKTRLSTGEGKYGRLFPHLASQTADEADLLALGRSGATMDLAATASAADSPDALATDNPRIPAGWPIYGQLIAHDITADRSLLQHHASVHQIANFRTPRLDLECLYGAGPTGNPYLYDLHDPDTFLLGVNDAGRPDDLPRNSQGIALIGDPRNDVHLPISQLHVTYLKFHNAVVGWLRREGVAAVDVFSEAQRLVRWHHQWIALHEYLSLSVGEELAAQVLRDGPLYYHVRDGAAFIPIEFSDAAYRFGHSQIRTQYRLNATATGTLFPDCLGMCPVPAESVIDWRCFFDLDPNWPPQASKRIDVHLAHSLIELPDQIVGATDLPEHHSLAVRDLLRARALDMPSGEAVAEAIGADPLTRDELGLPPSAVRHGTPLWYYVLREAEVRHHGERLGAVGGRIVADVLVGLVDADPLSYRSMAPDWRPMLPAAREGEFGMADLLRLAGVAS